MPRNFERRVEVMFPVESPLLRQRIVDSILPAYLRDNVRARILLSDGTYVSAKRDKGEPLHRSQEELLASSPGAGGKLIDSTIVPVLTIGLPADLKAQSGSKSKKKRKKR